ncbi:MAG: nucleotidyltransferase domain-containing protein [Thermoplasmatota archaeon]
MKDNISLSRLLFQRGKLKVLEELLDQPEKEYSIRQLSKESGASYDLTHRFVGKLSELGIVKKKKVGGAVIIQLNERSPYVDKLKELVKIDFKPLIEKAKEFAEKIDEKKEGIKTIILFGSVSRGTPKIGSDVDILILTDENTSDERKEEIESYANKIASKYEREEKITFVPMLDSFESFKEDLETGEPFALEVKKEGIKLRGESPW